MKPPSRVVDALQFALIVSVLVAATTAPDWLPLLLGRAAATARRPDRCGPVPPPSEGGPVP